MHERNALMQNMVFAQYFAWKNYLGQLFGSHSLGGKYPEENYPGANCTGGNFAGDNCLGDNYPGGIILGSNCPGVSYPGRQLSGVKLSGGNYPESNCPRTPKFRNFMGIYFLQDNA